MCSRDQTGRHICASVGCAVGRPFLVRGAERLAEATARGDWLEEHVRPEVRGLPAELRSRLAAHWTRVGLMEHASIAAFARFALHLLSVGAPPELVRAAQQAMGDETTHARLAFALATAYGGAPVGPGLLVLEGALDDLDVRYLVAALVREGCIGETVAAVEALEARESAADVAVRRALAIIARDEQRHAKLAWRALAWLVDAGRVSAATVREEFAAASVAQAPPSDRIDEGLSTHGVVGGRRSTMLRAETLTRVIWPLVRARYSAAQDHCRVT